MLPLGLRAAEQRAFHRALCDHHWVMDTVQLMSLKRKRLRDVSLRVIEGEVSVNQEQGISRVCSLNLHDPNGHLSLSSTDPADGAIFLNNAIRVIKSYWSPEFPAGLGWVDVPVFDGPVVAAPRDGNTIAVSAVGWEKYAREGTGETKTIGAGTYVVDAIRQLMRMADEHRFDIPQPNDLPRVLTKSISVTRTQGPWGPAQDLADSVDRQLFYDGRGRLRLRRLPKKPVWVFSDGDDGNMTAELQINPDLEGLKNAAIVEGHKPKGGDRVTSGPNPVTLPPANPLSPRALARTEDGRHLLLSVIRKGHLKTRAECYNHAVEYVNSHAEQALGLNFDALTVPHLEPMDMVGADTHSMQDQFPLRGFTIPLGRGGTMPVGYTREIVRGKRARKRPIHNTFIPDKPTLEGPVR